MTAADLYLRVREREGRLLPDEVVRRLPDVPADHPLKEEWQARAASLGRLKRYLERQQQPMLILELGCGNGWLSHHLASVPGAKVWGVDRQSSELAQAARVFAEVNPGFAAVDIWQAPFAAGTFDMIVIASAIQYFPDLPRLIGQLCDLVRPDGEVHIIDSPLYEETELRAAQERTQAYYEALGFPEMASHYFHHTYGELEKFAPRRLYQPDTLQGRLLRSLGGVDSPFPWLCIRRGG